MLKYFPASLENVLRQAIDTTVIKNDRRVQGKPQFLIDKADKAHSQYRIHSIIGKWNIPIDIFGGSPQGLRRMLQYNFRHMAH